MARRATIGSRSNAQMVRIRRLQTDPVAYRKLGMAWLEGEHLLQAALAHGIRLDEVFVDESRVDDVAIEALLEGVERVAVVESRLWRDVSALPSPPAVGALIRPICSAVQPGASAVVLDRLQDAGNVGSILRSAAAFGVRQLIALKGCAALWSPKVLRSAMGAHFAMQLLEEAGEAELSSLGVPMVATSSRGGVALTQGALPEPCAWVFGHEGQGVAEVLLRRCAVQVHIPQPGGEESLNVAAAAAICLYESMRRRQ
jgi:TrmH family RNA methyltransferase